MSTTETYFDLRIPAPRRLAAMRRAFDEHDKKYPHCPPYAKPTSWRSIRGTTHTSVAAYCGQLSTGMNDGKPIWYCHNGPYFKREKPAHEIVNLNHTGWFTDTLQSDTIAGLVVRLPHGRFLAGTYESDNNERVYYPTVYDCERDAAWAADDLARLVAQAMVQDSERYDEANALMNKCESRRERLKECLALRNQACFKHLRQEAQELVHWLREATARLDTEFKDVL